MKFLPFASAVCFASILGCGPKVVDAPVEQPKPVATSPVVVAAPPDHSLVQGEDWTMRLVPRHSWVVEEVAAHHEPSGLTIELAASSNDPESAAALELLSIATNEKDLDFIKSFVSEEAKDPMIRMVDAFPVNLKSGEKAAGMVQFRKTSNGVMLVFELVAAKNGRAYVARCGGNPKESKKVQAVCGETLDSFSFKQTSQTVSR